MRLPVHPNLPLVPPYFDWDFEDEPDEDEDEIDLTDILDRPTDSEVPN